MFQFLKNMKIAPRRVFLFCIIPCLLAVLFTGFYSLGISPRLNLVIVNELCIPLAILEISLGLIETQNKSKAYLLASALAICSLLSYVNLQSEPSPDILSNVSAWTMAWLLAWAVSLLALVWISIRLFRWKQEEWEQVKALAQAIRLEIKKARSERRKARQLHLAEMARLKFEYKQKAKTANIQSKLDKQKAKAEVKQKKQEQKSTQGSMQTIIADMGKIMDALQNWVGKAARTLFKFCLEIILPLCISALFVFLPVFQGIQNGALNWIGKVSELTAALLGPEKVGSPLNALLNYILLFSLGTGIVMVLFIIVFQIFGSNLLASKPDEEDFSKKYGTPIAILVVAWAALMVMTQNDSSIFDVADGWSSLLVSILFILVILTSVEIVRLVLEQCAKPHSLLNELLRLIFIVILEFFVSVILGVITNFRIQTAVSSLFSLIFPESDESFQMRVNHISKSLFRRELNDILNSESRADVFQKFHKKQVWRRRNK